MTWLAPARAQLEQGRRPARRHAGQLEGLAGRGRRRGRRRRTMEPRPGRETVGGEGDGGRGAAVGARAPARGRPGGSSRATRSRPGRTVLRRMSAVGGATRSSWCGTSTASPCSWRRCRGPITPRTQGGLRATSSVEGDFCSSCTPHPVRRARLRQVVSDGLVPASAARAPRGPDAAVYLLDRHGPIGLSSSCSRSGCTLASALHYLASRGRSCTSDVKPDNVVMGAPPRLIDLSVARSGEAAGRLRRPVGTDGYMAPEQCDAAFGPSARPADVFGLGVTMFRAHAGAPPFPRAQGAGASKDAAVAPAARPRAGRAAAAHAGAARRAAARDARAATGRCPAAAEVVAALEPVVADLPRRLVLGRRGWRPGR